MKEEEINYEPNSKKDKSNTFSRVLYIVTFTIALVVMEKLSRNKLKELSFLFFRTDTKLCDLLKSFEFYHVSGRYLIFFVILNFINVYAALSLIFLDCFGVFLNGGIRLFYLEARPFWEHPDLPPCLCGIDYGNPSTTGLNRVLVFATLYRSFTYKRNPSVWTKALIIILSVGYITFIYITRMMQNIHYLNHLLFAAGIGYVIHYTYYEVFRVDYYSYRQFKMLLDYRYYVIATVLLSWLLMTGIHVSLNLEEPAEYIPIILRYCKIDIIFSFDHESYARSLKMFEFLGYFIGILLEYELVFKGDYKLFRRYNINSKYPEIDELFNQTNTLKTLIRILIYFLIQHYILESMVANKYSFDFSKDYSFMHYAIINLTIPYIIGGIVNFFLIKTNLRYFNLTNEYLFTEEFNQLNKDLVNKL